MRDDQSEFVGIVSIGTYVPAGVETSRDMAERSGFPEYVFTDKIGVHQKPVAAPGEHPSDMALAAARDALAKAGLSGRDLDLVVYSGVCFYDYGVWSPAARIQHELGASRAFAYEVKNGCNSGNLGVYLASRQLLADPDLEVALVVCSDVVSRLIDYTDENLLSLFASGDAATAAVVRKGHPGNRILSHVGISDGELCDAVFVPAGGTREGGSAGGGSARFRIQDPARLARVFSEIYLENYVHVVREALRRSGRSTDEIALLLTNQVKQSTLDGVLAALGLTREQTCRTMDRYGHLTASDTLFGLAESLAAGRVGAGDLVVLASSGIGFHWAATVLEH